MSGTHDKLLHGNTFHHWKFSDLVLDLNYFSFCHHNPCRNPTYLSKHKFLNPNNQFYRRIWYVEYNSVHAYIVWSQKFRLTPGPKNTHNPAGVDSGNPDPVPPLVQSHLPQLASPTKIMFLNWKHGPPADPVSSEISDLCKISDLLLYFSHFPSQNKEIKSGNQCFGVCCVN